MKKLVLVCLMLTVLSSWLFAGGRGDAGRPITLRYAHVGIPGEIQSQFAYDFAELVRQRTNGQVIIQVFPNSQLGGVLEMVDGVRSGAICIGQHEFSSLERFVSEMGAYNAPFVFRDTQHVLAATCPRTSPVMQRLNNDLIRAGNMRVIGRVYRGKRQLSTNFPVFSPADLSGRRIRGVPTPIFMTMIQGMGAIPTPIDITELYTALLTGVVEGQENPITNIYTQRFHEVQTHIMMTAHMVSIPAVFINERVWQSLSPEHQRILYQALEDANSLAVQRTYEDEAPLIRVMEAAGVTFIDEAAGLRLDLFRQGVAAQMAIDYPQWNSVLRELENIR